MKLTNLFKMSIRYPLLFIVVSILWQLLVHQSINWYNAIGVGIFMFLFNFIYEWSKIPFEWKKKNNS